MQTNHFEIMKLALKLKEANVPFEFFVFDKSYKHGFQILYPNAKNRICSVIENEFSYGHENDLLEIMGLVSVEEEKRMGDEVLGCLTADDVYQRIKKHYQEENA